MRPAPLLLAAGLTACGLLPTSPPSWVTDRSEMPSCGEVTLDRALDAGERGWDCLAAAVANGDEAELIRHLTTIEGDPVTEILRVHADGAIELMVDATRDRFGSGRWERLECERLLPGGGWEGCVEVGAP